MASPLIRIRPLPAPLKPWSFAALVATWFHSGRIAPASGTWGSLAALPFVLTIWFYSGSIGLLAFTVLTFAVGMVAIPPYAKAVGDKDPSEVVIDEVVGMGMTFLPLTGLNPWVILFGFAIFRIVDATKPGLVGWCDRQLKGAWGVMMDDVVAGVFAAFCVYGLQRALS